MFNITRAVPFKHIYKEVTTHSSIFIFSEILLLGRNVLRLKVPSQGAMYVVIEQGS